MKHSPIMVSVIIPVYNPGAGIVRCIRSLQNQSLKNIEMIFIDDCGTDEACEYIEKAASDDGRIILLGNARNIGAGPSRNRGIEEAQGRYLAFVDPDDYIADDFLELLYRKAIETDTDIVKGVLKNVDENDIPDSIEDPCSLNTSIKEGMKEGKPLYSLFTFQHTTAIYRREMVISTQVLYGSSNISEDAVFLLKAGYAANSIEFEDKAVYYYVARQKSAVRNFALDRWDGTFISLKEMLRFIDEKKIYTTESYQYAITRIISILDLQQYYRDNEPSIDSGRMLDQIRKLTASTSFCNVLIKEDVIIDALMTFEKNLSINPYGRIWRVVPYMEYKRRVDIWVDFLGEHPEYGKRCQKYLWKLFEDSIVCKGAANESERKQHLKYLRLKVRCLPDKTVLTKDFIAMRLFVDYGIDAFGLRNTWIGEAVKSIAAKIRKTG